MNNMDVSDAYDTLKESIHIDKDTEGAYEVAITNEVEYRDHASIRHSEAKASIQAGQSLIALGEIVRQFYNATHRCVDGKIIDIPGAEMCEDLGKTAFAAIESTIIINECTEQMACAKLSCDETVDMSYI